MTSLTLTKPESGTTRPETKSIKVDFPEPLGPHKPKIEFVFITLFKFLKIRVLESWENLMFSRLIFSILSKDWSLFVLLYKTFSLRIFLTFWTDFLLKLILWIELNILFIPGKILYAANANTISESKS